MDNSSLTRLDRIEQKIDKMSEIVITLARAEEKLINLEIARNRQEEVNDAVDERLSEVERLSNDNEVTIRVINRIFWILVSAGLVALVGRYLSGLLPGAVI